MKNNHSREKIINKAFNLHSQKKFQEAAKYYQYCINRGFKNGLFILIMG